MNPTQLGPTPLNQKYRLHNRIIRPQREVESLIHVKTTIRPWLVYRPDEMFPFFKAGKLLGAQLFIMYRKAQIMSSYVQCVSHLEEHVRRGVFVVLILLRSPHQAATARRGEGILDDRLFRPLFRRQGSGNKPATNAFQVPGPCTEEKNAVWVLIPS